MKSHSPIPGQWPGWMIQAPRQETRPVDLVSTSLLKARFWKGESLILVPSPFLLNSSHTNVTWTLGNITNNSARERRYRKRDPQENRVGEKSTWREETQQQWHCDHQDPWGPCRESAVSAPGSVTCFPGHSINSPVRTMPLIAWDTVHHAVPLRLTREWAHLS